MWEALKVLILVFAALISLPVFSDSVNQKKQSVERPEPISIFDVTPLNSPVKDSIAKFLIKFPQGFNLNQVKYKIESSSRIFDEEEVYKKIDVINGLKGKELHVSVSKLLVEGRDLSFLIVSKGKILWIKNKTLLKSNPKCIDCGYEAEITSEYKTMY